jgi:hypothetical protein
MHHMRTLLKTAIFFLLALSTACSALGHTPTPEAAAGPIYIDGADLLIMESYPVQISLHLTGNLPTPCHEFHFSYQIGTPKDRFRVDFTVWSESDPGRLCAQVLEPFNENLALPMGGAPDGTYTVWLNGDFVGEFSFPG